MSEDRLAGFRLDPFGAMLRSGTIRRVRQTLTATNLAAGAPCAPARSGDRLRLHQRVLGGRSEIEPSETAPDAYLEFCKHHALDPEAMR